MKLVVEDVNGVRLVEHDLEGSEWSLNNDEFCNRNNITLNVLVSGEFSRAFFERSDDKVRSYVDFKFSSNKLLPDIPVIIRADKLRLMLLKS